MPLLGLDSLPIHITDEVPKAIVGSCRHGIYCHPILVRLFKLLKINTFVCWGPWKSLVGVKESCYILNDPITKQQSIIMSLAAFNVLKQQPNLRDLMQQPRTGYSDIFYWNK